MVLCWAFIDDLQSCAGSGRVTYTGKQSQADLPEAVAQGRVEGEVRVSFVVKADGSVSAISIVQSDHPDLAEAVKDAITQWRFKPWTAEDGRPAEQPVVAPMLFDWAGTSRSTSISG
ncbi:energy transducer TonB [Pseudomonas parakoreensis]